ncbi:MAG: hypothetical protein GY820_31195 [Gammaproteobacteria bacterium]|nr:hypothetical protein [Gammaproteobacteria bacterium]
MNSLESLLGSGLAGVLDPLSMGSSDRVDEMAAVIHPAVLVAQRNQSN